MSRHGSLGGEGDGRLSREGDFPEEVEVLEFLKAGALVGLFQQDAGYQVFELRGSADVLGEGEGALLDFPVGVLYIFRFEGRSSIDKCIADDSETPNVYFVAVSP